MLQGLFDFPAPLGSGTRVAGLKDINPSTSTAYLRAINGELPAAHCVLKIMDRRAKLLGLDKPEKVEVNKWDFNAEDLDAEVQRIVTMMNEREDQFMERREAEVRKEMRSQFEIEKRLEKELASKESAENARAALMKMLDLDAEEKDEWKPSGIE